MRILWLSSSRGLLNNRNSYNGEGWISSLQRVVEQEKATLALAYPSQTPHQQETIQGTTYYPIFMAPRSPLQKLKYYYGGYKRKETAGCVDQLLSAIKDFQPDIIHLFGLESQFACILGKTDKPVVVHLQGLLSPCSNAFFPPGFNRWSFLFPLSVNEWVLRNGFIFAHRDISFRGRRELELFRKMDFAMGRTAWDRQLCELLAPQAGYFHVDEVLRPSFYNNAATWKPTSGSFVITSTISQTVYKGLDLILKTAQLLHDLHINTEWHVVGISQQSRMVKHFERCCHVKSRDVGIMYHGVMNEEELTSLLLRSSVYVHPSYIDNSPNSLCEAQMLGLPVIATNVGGVSTLISNGETGFLVPANAPYELAYLIKQLQQSQDLQTTIARKGAATAALRHDRDTIAKALLSTYETIVTEWKQKQ